MLFKKTIDVKQNLILDLSFSFAIRIIEFCEGLEKEKKYVLAKQLLKSGTSIGANVREAQRPHSKADFAAKIIIALKEAEETKYWLLLCLHSKNYPNPDYLLKTIDSIIKILSKIASSTRQTYKSP